MTMMGIDQNTVTGNTYGIYINELGYSGYSGASGYSGYSGFSGASGQSGISGFSGESFSIGYSGESGWSGWSGTAGAGGTVPSAPYAQATAASTCATGAWTSLISIGVQPNNSVNPFIAVGGFHFSYGANAGHMSLMMTVNGTAADGSQRTIACAEGSGSNIGLGLWASHLASGTSYNIAIQYSTGQAATIYDRQIGGLLG